MGWEIEGNQIVPDEPQLASTARGEIRGEEKSKNNNEG